MSKKRTKNRKKKYDPSKTLRNLNADLMPIAGEIQEKMDMLKSQFGFDLDFAFPEITMNDLMGKK